MGNIAVWSAAIFAAGIRRLVNCFVAVASIRRVSTGYVILRRDPRRSFLREIGVGQRSRSPDYPVLPAVFLFFFRQATTGIRNPAKWTRSRGPLKRKKKKKEIRES